VNPSPPEFPEEDTALTAFLRQHSPAAPAPTWDLEDRIFQALEKPLDGDAPLVAFLQDYAPVAPSPPLGLEQRILDRVAKPNRTPLLVLCTAAAALVLAFAPQLWTMLQTATPQTAEEVGSELSLSNSGVFDVNPDTGLYDVRL
jgi:hypothetical protein